MLDADIGPLTLSILAPRTHKTGVLPWQAVGSWLSSACFLGLELFAPDFPSGAVWVEHHGCKRAVLDREGERIRLDGPLKANSAEVTILALVPTGDPTQLQCMTQQYWAKFWEATPEVDLDQIQLILQDIPLVPPFNSEITVEEVTWALNKLDSRRARGPDQWSNFELRSLPEDCVIALTAIFNAITQFNQWPEALLSATVTMLSKMEAAFELAHTRPITVLSTIYRLWAKIVSRKFINNCLPWLPQGVQGNRPKASSRWVATMVQTLAEHALITNTPFHFASLDLTKAYNLLQRDVLRLTNARFGTPKPIWEAYSTFLSKVTRHFKIHGSVSPGMTSKAGCPEGDALAVYQMAQLNWLTLAQVERTQTLEKEMTMISYVDNWIYFSYLNNVLRSTLETVYDFQKVAGFSLSPQKTWLASTSTLARGVMKEWTFQNTSPPVCYSKVELGMLLRFSRSAATAEVAKRWDEGLLRATRLIHKNWTVPRKISTIVQGIFPMIFAGCETVHISMSTFRTIRARLNVAVMGKSSFSSHILTPFFAAKDSYEPFIYVAQVRLASLRSSLLTFGLDKAQQSWNSLMHLDLTTSQHKILGPVGLFVWVCLVLKWKILDDLRIEVEPGLAVHLLYTPRKTWHILFRQAWVDYALRQFLHKKGHIFGKVSVSARTWKSMWSRYKSLPPLSLKSRTFGLLTSSAIARIQDAEQATCDLCNGPNPGQVHIVTECEALKDVRDLPQFYLVKGLPLFTRCSGIPCIPARLSLPQPPTPSPMWTSTAAVFTDGSAAPVDLPNARMSSWAVVKSHPLGEMDLVAAGPTPGPVHNILRAETYAVLMALRAVTNVALYVDNSVVVHCLRLILERGFTYFDWESRPDCDLWAAIAAELISRPFGSVSVVKVKSHSRRQDARSPMAQWIIAGNDYADCQAKKAFRQAVDGTHFEKQVKEENKAIDEAFLASQLLHALAERTFQIRSTKKQKEEDKLQLADMRLGSPSTVPVTPWFFRGLASYVHETWDEKWLRLTEHYFASLKWPKEANPSDVGISLMEMMLDLLISFQVRIPINVAAQKLHLPGIPVLPPKSPAKYVLLSRSQGRSLPQDVLTNSVHTFLRTFDFLYARIHMTPCIRENLRTLAPVGFTNVVPSLRATPTLLAGHEARRLLSRILIPGVRVLKYPYSIPRREPLPLPAGFPSDF